MATLEERLRKLAAKKDAPVVPPVENKTTKKQTPVTPTATTPKPVTGDTATKEPIKQKIQKQAVAVVDNLKQEADTMEHSMVTKLCNNITGFMFKVLTYPLELLDSWILCKRLIKSFNKKAELVFYIYLGVLAILSLTTILAYNDITVFIASVIFLLVITKLLGVK